MSASTAIPPQSLHPDEQPVAESRSVSRAALASLGLGVASALILVSPLLAPVAFAAAITAVIALRGISASEGQLVGRWAALAGLCLAMLFLGWGFARQFGRQSALVGHARRTADAWLELVQTGRLKEALQFRQPSASRLSTTEALSEHHEKNPEAAQELKGFTTNQGVKDLIDLRAKGEPANVRFEGVVSNSRDGFSDRLVLKYSYDRAAAGESQPVRGNLWIHLTRRTDEITKLPDWQIVATDVNPPPATE